MQSHLITEEWRPVVGYEGWYSVSSFGRVRRDKAARGTVPGHILRGYANKRGGYLTVGLNRRHRGYTMPIHRLVARAFLGDPAPRHQVNHKDGDVTNNNVTNVEWATPSQNTVHALAVLGKTMGRKLTDGEVRFVYLSMDAATCLAEQFGVSPEAIRKIRARTTYGYLTNANRL